MGNRAKEIVSVVGLKIRDLREKKGLTQAQLGKILNKTDGTIRMWELGKSEPDNNTLILLSQIFGVSTDYLLDIDKVVMLNIVKDYQLSSNQDEQSYEELYEKDTVVPLLKSELKELGNLTKDNIFAFRIPDNSMSPWYYKGDIVILKKDSGAVFEKDNLVIYEADNKAKIRYVCGERNTDWLDISCYNYIQGEYNIDKKTTHIENKFQCVFFGYVIKVIRNTNQSVDFLLNR